MYLEAYENLSSFWKRELLPKTKPIFQEDNRDIQCGIMFDPSTFIPHYMRRFLMRQEKEGRPLSPGHYKIVLKVRLPNSAPK